MSNSITSVFYRDKHLGEIVAGESVENFLRRINNPGVLDKALAFYIADIADQAANFEVGDNRAGDDAFLLKNLSIKSSSKVKPNILDLRSIVSTSANEKIVIVDAEDDISLEVIRHSTAHLMAQAFKELFPKAQVAIGPATETGFYYDFYLEGQTLSTEDLSKIEDKMRELTALRLPVVRRSVFTEEAKKFFREMGEHFKVEIIEEIEKLGSDEVFIYSQGNWSDLCRGPHVLNLSQLKYFKLLRVAGAYWRGNEKNPMLQRVYGTAFGSKEALESYLFFLKEAEERDHRNIGKQLDILFFHPWAPGQAFFTEKGSVIFAELTKLVREGNKKFGFTEVITPQVFDVQLFQQSGHYDHYRDDMFFLESEGKSFALKPMNCPGHCLLFQRKRVSYRDLPLRYADVGRLHRNERSGALHGLTRVRAFSQDDAHIFCSLDQLEEEIPRFFEFVRFIYQAMGLTSYKVVLSTRPDSFLGAAEDWEKAESILKDSIEKLCFEYEIHEKDGAFYGPKIDLLIYDSLHRPHQLGTLQLDFQLPRRFHLSFVGSDNKPHTPIILHRAILGSFERFIGVMLEHFPRGKMPLWLSPDQVVFITVNDEAAEKASQLKEELSNLDIRCYVDDRNEKINAKIRDAQLAQVPVMVVLGAREISENKISYRIRDENLRGECTWDIFVRWLIGNAKNRVLKLTPPDTA